MNLEHDFDLYLRARFTLMVLLTVEEERALAMLKAVCDQRSRSLILWDVADGFRSFTGPQISFPAINDPLAALNEIESSTVEGVFALLDYHNCWDYPPVKRKLRTLSRRLKSSRKSIVIVAPSVVVPEELRNESVVLHMPFPNAGELEKVLGSLEKTPGITVNLTAEDRDRMCRAAVGLTALQAQRIFAKAIVEDGKLDGGDIALVANEKQDIIRGSEVLEYYPPRETADDVGGLDELKEWLTLRAKAFSKEAQAYGISAPKGIALIGIPGTGKSLTAKMIGTLWQVPIVKFDVGALFRPYIGQSEETLRKALKMAESIAPCVLWIDEIEKALSQGDHDGGTSKRVFGSILTWMQDKPAGCFVVATANDVTKLPPELLRRGRFDEIFFLDLPNAEERKAIFDVHLHRKKRDPKKFDLLKLSEVSAGYVGAEIEQALNDAMFAAFNQGREFATDDVAEAIKKLVPLSISQREVLANLQRWIDEGRAKPASKRDGVSSERLNHKFGFGA